MPDHLYRAQVVLHRDSGLAKDQSTNTWYFDKDETSAGDWASGADNLADRLAQFYIGNQGRFGLQNANTFDVKVYDMRDAEPRVPKHVESYTWAPGDSGLPAEVALVLSFRATVESGVNMKRRKGRVFLGPLSTGTVSQSSNAGDVRPESTTMAAFLASGLALVLDTAGDPRLAIYSPTTDATSTVDDAFFDVEDLWIDNSFDTQRRRGGAPTVRTFANVVG